MSGSENCGSRPSMAATFLTVSSLSAICMALFFASSAIIWLTMPFMLE